MIKSYEVTIFCVNKIKISIRLIADSDLLKRTTQIPPSGSDLFLLLPGTAHKIQIDVVD